MDGFNQKGYIVWALDARGYGETPRDDTGWNTPDWHYQHQYNALDATKVTMSVLLLQGEFDPLAHTDFHADAFSKFPNADKQWVVLKGGDHAALLETPRAKLIDSSIGFIEWLKK